MKPLKEKEILNPKEMESLFSNLRDIKNLNELLLADLKQGKKHIGDIFLFYTEYFKLYTTYCADQPKSFMTFQKYQVPYAFQFNSIRSGVTQSVFVFLIIIRIWIQKTKPAFVQFLKEAKEKPQSRKLPLDSFLMSKKKKTWTYCIIFPSQTDFFFNQLRYNAFVNIHCCWKNLSKIALQMQVMLNWLKLIRKCMKWCKLLTKGNNPLRI